MRNQNLKLNSTKFGSSERVFGRMYIFGCSHFYESYDTSESTSAVVLNKTKLKF